MSAFSNYYENKIIDHMIRGEVFTPPTTIYVALFTADSGLEENIPTAEISMTGTAYTRQVVVLNGASDGEASNSSDISWDIATINWGEVTHAAIVDHPTNINWGVDVNILMWNNIATSKTIYVDDMFKILATKFNITVQ